MEYDVLLHIDQSNGMGQYNIQTQAEFDALSNSVWQKQYYQTYNDGVLKFQNLYPKDAFVSRDYIQFWEYQNKYGEVANDVTTTFAQKSPQNFVNYFIELDGDGRIVNSMFYNDTSNVFKYPFAWDYAFALQMFKFVGISQRIVKVVISAVAITNVSQQTFKKDPVVKPNDNLYERCIEEIQAVKAKFIADGDTIRKFKILWGQGEQNNPISTTTISQYKTEFLAIIDGLRTEIGDPNTQVIIRRVGPESNGDLVAGIAQLQLAEENDNIFTWDDFSYPSDADGVDFSREDFRARYYRQKGDKFHISPIGQWRVGIAIAKFIQANVTGY